MTYNVTNMGDIEEEEEEEEDTTESRLRVCSSQEPSPSPPASPLSPTPSSVRVIKSESVSWPPLSQASQGSQVSQPPVMTIPPLVLSELMSCVETPVSAQSSSVSRVPPHSPRKQSLKMTQKPQSASFRPIEPNISLQSPPLSLRPLPLSRLSDLKQARSSHPSEQRTVHSLQPALPINVRLSEVPRILLPQHPLPNVKKK